MNILNHIGNTPLLNIENIYVKCEHLNPSGSVKDRIAKCIIEKAEKTGQLKKNYKIVGATTGNTGISLSMVAAIKGYRIVIYMPRGLSEERSKIMKLFGAEIRYVPKNRTDIAQKKAAALGKRHGYYHTKQFSNRWNYEEHEKNMGCEITRQLKGKKIDAIVAGIGTGGTLIGLAKAFKKLNKKVKVYGVEPYECALTYGLLKNRREICKPHRIEGIADGFVPEIIKSNLNLIDGIIKIKSRDAIKESRRIAKKHGLLVGICSGANLLAAKKIKKQSSKLRTIVTIFTDRGARYLSERWFVN
jgi:cysteine synthase